MPGSAISWSCEMLQFSASLKSSVVFIYKMDTITLALTSSIVDEIKWDDPNISGKLKKKKDNLKSNSPNLIPKFYKTHYQVIKSVSTFANIDNDIYFGGKMGTLRLIYTNFILHSSC